MTNPSNEPPRDAQPAAVPRQPWTAPRVRALPVGRTDFGATNYNVADAFFYTS